MAVTCLSIRAQRWFFEPYVMIYLYLSANIKLHLVESAAEPSSVRWTDLFLPGVPSSNLRDSIKKSFGIVDCQENPGEESSAGNLLAAFNDRPFGGWRGKGFRERSRKLGYRKGFKYEGMKNSVDGPDLTFTDLERGTYNLIGWVKLESGVAEKTRIHNSIRFPGQNVTQGRVIASGEAKTSCWTKLQGGFFIENTTNVTLHLGGVQLAANVSFASYSVSQVDPAKWRKQQNVIINKIRKRDVKLNFVNKAGRKLHTYVVLDQIQSDFPFGGSASGSIIVDQTYQRWMKERFTWTVYENEAKWYSNEGLPGQTDYTIADAMTTTFRKLGITIRGHNVIWDSGYYQPWWLHVIKNVTQLKERVNFRIKDVVTRYKGKFAHWDVLNEPQHGDDYFERRLNDPNFASSVFRQVNSYDPNVLTFVNDFNIIEQYNDPGSTPEDFVATVTKIESQGGRVYGYGAESHFLDTVDGPLMRSKLDRLAKGSKPIWITELTVMQEKVPSWNSAEVKRAEEKQADMIEVAMREAFSHPAVEGIVFWGPARPSCKRLPWNYPDPRVCNGGQQALLSDESFRDRPQGLRYLSLRQEWSTHRSRWTKNDGSLSFRGFFGTYKVKVVHLGKEYTSIIRVPKGLSRIDFTITVPV